jgi:hypothetical protein
MGKTVKKVGKSKDVVGIKSVAVKAPETTKERRRVKLEKILFSGSISRIAKEIGGITGMTREFKEILSKCSELHLLDVRDEIPTLVNGKVQIVKPRHVAFAFQTIASRKSPNWEELIEPFGIIYQEYQAIDAKISKPEK